MDYRKTLAIGLILLCAPIAVQAEDDPAKLLEAVVKVQASVPETARTARSLGTQREGSGVVIDDRGLVLTIGYLVIEARSITVATADGTVVPAAFVGYDHDTGFGLLRTVRPLPAIPVTLGDSSAVSAGEGLLMVTHEGREAVRGGRVIARGEFAGYWEYLLDDAIYVAPPHEDFAGAALIDRDGRLVGVGSIYTQVALEGLGSVPCNMFVPIDLLKPILPDLLRLGHTAGAPRPWLGVHVEETLGRVIVRRALPDGPAEKAGLRTGDIILKVKQAPVAGLSDFFRKTWAVGPAGEEVTLSVLQGTEVVEIRIKSVDRRSYLRLKPGTGGDSARRRPPTEPPPLRAAVDSSRL